MGPNVVSTTEARLLKIYGSDRALNSDKYIPLPTFSYDNGSRVNGPIFISMGLKPGTYY